MFQVRERSTEARITHEETNATSQLVNLERNEAKHMSLHIYTSYLFGQNDDVSYMQGWRRTSHLYTTFQRIVIVISIIVVVRTIWRQGFPDVLTCNKLASISYNSLL